MAKDDALRGVLRPGIWSREKASTSVSSLRVDARCSKLPPIKTRQEALPELSETAKRFLHVVKVRFGAEEAARVVGKAAEAKEGLLAIWERRAKYFGSLDEAMSYRLTSRLAVEYVRFDDVFEHAVCSALKRWCLRLLFFRNSIKDYDLHALAEWLRECPDYVIHGVEADLANYRTALLVCGTESTARALKAGTRRPLFAQLYSPEGRLPSAF